MVFQSSLGTGTEGCTERFYKSSGRIIYTLILSLSQIIQKDSGAKELLPSNQGDFEIYVEGVKPLKATGSRWIDHRIRAMGHLVDKLGLHASHMK